MALVLLAGSFAMPKTNVVRMPSYKPSSRRSLATMLVRYKFISSFTKINTNNFHFVVFDRLYIYMKIFLYKILNFINIRTYVCDVMCNFVYNVISHVV